MNQFFILDKNRFDEGKYAYSKHASSDFRVGDYEKCPVCGGAVSMCEQLPPIIVNLSSGFLGDFIYGEIYPFIVSHNFKVLFETSSLVGIDNFVEVEINKINRRKNETNLKYYVPKIARSNARIDEEKSGITRSGTPKCLECKRGTIVDSIKGLNLIESTWTSEDIFHTRWLSAVVFTSERFVDFINDNKLTNAGYVSLEAYESRF